MQLGLIGLGRMGGNMRERIRAAGHEVVGFDHNPDISDVSSLAELVRSSPRPAWSGPWCRPARSPRAPSTS